MLSFTEDTFEQAVIELFENMRYTHIYAPDMNRTNYSRPLLDDVLRDCLVRLNRSLRDGLRQEVFGNFSKFIRLSARKPLVTSCLHISLNIFSIGFLAVSDCFTHTIKVVLPICTE